ncbi:MAG: hypothetical protein ABID61_03155 [Candidatus Micrarchaeota archaeon]
MDETEIGAKLFDLEIETQTKVSHSISLIEVAIADWEGTKKKPQHLAAKIDYLRTCHGLFSNWEKKSLKGKKDLNSVTKRLRDFVSICKKIELEEHG